MIDRLAGVVPNLKGRVLSNMEQTSCIEAGLFVVGWLKRGPTGIIGTNLIDADETVISASFSVKALYLCCLSASEPSMFFP